MIAFINSTNSAQLSLGVSQRIRRRSYAHQHAVPFWLAQQLCQLGDVGGDAPGPFAGEELGRRAPVVTSRDDCLRTAKKC
jgi:hypothetical protein